MQIFAPQSGFAPWDEADKAPLLSLRAVSKRFGDFTAVSGLKLDIYEREFFALLGPSGCGKTTLMRMIAGFEEPSDGQILLDGQDLTHTPVNQRPINMMFQSYALFPHLSVERNIGFGLRQEGKPAAYIREQVDKMLTLTQLEPFAKRRPHQLSGGQRQRVALARSLAKSPRILLLDEPLAALDKKLREDTQFELMSIQEQLGITFIIVTHDQDEAMTVASRIALMRAGQIEQMDTPGRIYEQPKSRFVADFIGDVSILKVGLQAAEDDTLSLTWTEGQPPLSVAREETLNPSTDQELWLALRPEKLSISRETPQADNAIPGKVLDIAYRGNTSTYHVEIAGGQILKVQRANRDAHSGAVPISWDEQVWISWSRTSGVLLAS